MGLNEFLDKLRELNIHLYVEGDKLKYEAPINVMTDEIKFQIKNYKQELIESLVNVNNNIRIPPIPPAPRTETLPLSYAQQRLWFLDQLEPGSPFYNMPMALRLEGSLNQLALEQGINEIIRRHENLRTTFVSVNAQAQQNIADPATTAVACVDLSNLPESTRQTLAQQIAQEEATALFDLAKGPLIRVRLILLNRVKAKQEAILLVTLHHIISDGWSNNVLTREFVTLYQACSEGKTSPLPELPIQYADYASWQRQWLDGSILQQQIDYWRHKLNSIPAMLELPTDHPRPAVMGYDGANFNFTIPPALSEQLQDLSRRHNLTLFVTMLTAFSILLSRHSQQTDICIGTPIANRQRLEIEELIGFFVNTLVLRVDLSDKPSFNDLITQVNKTVLEAQSHQDLPFEQLVTILAPERSMGYSPLFQVIFTLQNSVTQQIEPIQGLAISGVESEGTTAKFDLSLHINQEETGILTCTFEYNTDLFEVETISRLAGHYLNLLQGVVEQPQRQVSQLPILNEDEIQQLLHGFNATDTEYPQDKCIHELFEAQAGANPGAAALVYEGESLSYGELNRHANRLAHRLIELGVKPDGRVAICAERGLGMVVGLLGVLKAGGAYVPLDPGYPEERLSYMLADSAPVAVLTQSGLKARLPGLSASLEAGSVPVILLGGEGRAAQPRGDSREAVNLASLCAGHPGHNPSPAQLGLTSRHLAYVIYTSGSTGQPKGVMVEHINAVNFINWSKFNFPSAFIKNTLFSTSINFDLAVFELFVTLSVGATVHIVEDILTSSNAPTSISLINTVPSAIKALLDTNQISNSVHSINLAGEVLKESLVERIFAFTEVQSVSNLYGPSETTTYSTWVTMTKAEGFQPHVGRPIANTQIYILDGHLQPVPIGVAGEIYIGGAGVARGYLGRAALTAERFVADPYGQGRLYKTGDLGRWLPDGSIEYLGRNDFQVKVRGFRIELGEVEAQLAKCAGVKEAVVVAREDVPGDKRLVAYVIAEEGREPTAADLRAQLSGVLAEYMVPGAYVTLESFPLTPNGKLDRKALPAPDGGSVTSRAYEAPQGETERAIAQIWQQLLHLDQVGRHDHFFELGGHSLMAVQLVSRLRQGLGIEAPLRDLFGRPVLADFAKTVSDARQAQLPPIQVADRSQPIPLSWAQQRLWFLDQLDPAASVAYHIPAGLRLQGKLDKAALKASLDRIVARHEVLRTRFVSQDGRAFQQIDPAHVGFALAEHDLGGLSKRKQRSAAEKIAAEEAVRPFALDTGPLIRGQLLKLDEDEHILLVTQHHIVSDGWSIGLLVEEFGALYAAFGQGQDDPLPELAVQYADYAAWQRQWLQGDALEAQMAFWQSHLTGAPALLELPTDRPRPAVQSYVGGSVGFELSKELSAGLRQLARCHGSTLFMVLMAGWSVLLARLSGQEDIVIGTPVANRQRTEVEPLIGFFVNTLALRVKLDGNPTVRGLLEQVNTTTLDAYGHQDIPFEQVVDLVKPERSMGHSPVFQVMLAMDNTPGTGELALPGLNLSGLEAPHITTQFDLSLSLAESGENIVGSLEYASELFGKATIERFIGYYQALLTGMVADAKQRIGQLPFLPETEFHQLIYGFNATAADYPQGKCVHELFEAQAGANPVAAALVYEGESLSYGELNRHANRLAHRLLELGIRPDERVAICVERSLEMVIGLLGILKAGGAYVPLDPGYPEERLAYMLADSAPVAVLTQSGLKARLPSLSASLDASPAPVILLDRGGEGRAAQAMGEGREAANLASLCAGYPEHNPEPAQLGLTSRHLAYVIYTSGSTGQPKGVMNQHQGVVNRLWWAQNEYRLTNGDRILQKTPFSFDVSVWEFFLPLMAGTELVIAMPQGHQDPEYLASLIARERITTIHFVPSMLHLFLEQADVQSCSASLKRVLCSGEALPYPLQMRFHSLLPTVELHNLYGPTEAAVDVTSWLCSLEHGLNIVPIGRPIANTQIYILDGHLQPVPIGVAGEIYIGGAGVARGYLGRAALTAERFVADPYGQGRLYKTGDLGRWLPDGSIEYLGRNDFQVKVRGFRIELGEVEAQLAKCAGVKEAVVVAREDVPGDKRLVAYVIAEEGREPTAADLRAQLSGVLAEYMVPGAYVTLESFPLTPNGKLDRKALPAPDGGSVTSRAYEAPQGETERAIAQIWQQLLHLDQVGRHDHFFELGGHSLMVVTLIERLRQRGMSATVRTVFTSPVLADMAVAITEQSKSAKHINIPPNPIPDGCAVLTPDLLPLISLSQEEIDKVIEQVPGGVGNIQDIYPLAPLQEGILFHHLLEQEGDAYLLRSVLSFGTKGCLDNFLNALQTVIDRHDILRTGIHWSGLPQPVQVVQRQAPLAVTELDTADVQDIQAWLLDQTDPRRMRIDISCAPLFATHMAYDSQRNEWLMALLNHHIICDHLSLELIIAEIQQILEGQAASLPEPLPYRNFIAQALAVSPAEHEAYFKAQLGDITEPTAPFGILDIQGDGSRINEATLPLADGLAQRIRASARQHGITAAVLFHAAWGHVLCQCTGRDQVVFGTVLLGRLQGSEGADRVLGMFINTLPVRVDLGNHSAQATIQATHRRLSDLLGHEQASLSLAQRCSAVDASLPLFTTLLNYRHSPSDATGGDVSAGNTMAGNNGHQQSTWVGIQQISGEERTNYPVTVSVDDLGQGFSLTAQCVEGIDPERITAYLNTAITQLVDALSQAPEIPISQLSILPEAERRQLLHGFNATAADYPQGKCVHELFEAQAGANPVAAALVYEGESLSYGELNRHANRLAHRLLELGIRPDERVAICVERSLEMVIGLLGILKAGGAYVPLDPGYPEERLAYMLADSAPVAVLTQSGLKARLPSLSASLDASPAPVILLDRGGEGRAAQAMGEGREAANLASLCAGYPEHNPEPAQLGLTSRHLAYVIYTSGSTGQPKGVMNQHQGVVNRLWWAQNEYRLTNGDRILQKTPFSFDVSVWEFFLPLMAGTELVIAMPQGHQDPEYLASLIARERITTIHFVPSMLHLFLEQADVQSCSASLKRVLCSGEALPYPLQMRFHSLLPTVELHNLYGPTEAAVDVTSWLCSLEHGLNIVPIGRPIANTQIYILDGHLQPVPIGVAGEIYIGGAGVARGYLGRAALTAERFVADPYGQGRLYKTGDLGRWLPDGSIEYLGRNDFQVKVRGFRIELGEVEAQLAKCAGVKEAVVVAREDVPGDKRLVAYVIAEEGREPTAADLRAQLSGVLAEYMVPGAYVTLESFPLTPNGKLDRKALPAPDGGSVTSRAYEAPQGETERAIAQIWQQLLHLDQVGRHDHFFELGGHSLMVVTLIERLRQRGMSATVRTVFTSPVLADMAVAITEQSKSAKHINIPPNPIPDGCAVLTPDLLPLISLSQEEIDKVIEQVPGGVGNIQDIYPLAPLQEGILFHHLLEQEGDAYLLRSVLSFGTKGCLDNFLNALQTVIDRHDILRTGIHWSGLPQPVQVVQRQAPLAVTELDTADVQDIQAWLLDQTDPRRMRIDISCAPLFATHMAYDSQRNEWLMALLNHHIICDHLSLELIIAEIQQILEGQAASLPEPLPYRNFIAQALAVSPAEHEAYFKAQLGDITEPTAPFGILDIQGDGSRINEATLPLADGLAQRIRASARQHGITAAVLFHAAWGHVLCQCTGRDQVVFGTVLLGRLQGSEGADRVLGMFINTLPVRVDLGNHSAQATIQATHRRLSDLLGHEQASLSLAQRCSAVDASLPLFTTLLNYRHSPSDATGGDVSAGNTMAGNNGHQQSTWVGIQQISGEERTNYPVTVSVDDLGQGFSLTAQCVEGIDPERITAYLNTAITQLVDALSQAPEIPISQLSILPEAERRQLLHGFNATAADYPQGKCVHELFEAQAGANPVAAALVYEGESLSYGELNRHANRLAHRLLELGIRPDERVAICVERSLEMVIGLLGILKAGGAYVPLDPGYPEERLAYMLADSAPVAVLTQSGLKARLPSLSASLDASPAPVILLDRGGEGRAAQAMGEGREAANLASLCAGYPEHNPEPAQLGLTSRHLAYVIYTSGSTGQPKGVMVSHANVGRLFAATEAQYHFTADDTWTLFHSFAFDFSVWEVWGPLSHGGRLLIIPHHTSRNPEAFYQLLAQERVTVLNQTPSAFRQLIAAQADTPMPHNLRCVIFGGEALEFHSLKPWIERNSLNDTQLINMYGITEITVHATYRSLTEEDIQAGQASNVGKPLGDLRFYILDGHLQPVPIGVAGEIYIGGAGVARGYLGRAALTAERFVADPYGQGRLYKTGDLGRWLPDGSIEYLGRNDFQVKVRGFRIELGEVEAQLAKCAGVKEAVVVAREDVPGDKRLVAYVIAEEGREPTAADLRAQLSGVLAEYMVPGAYVTLESFPLTPNGKLDRKALPAPDGDALMMQTYCPPRNLDEEVLATIWASILGVEKVGIDDGFFVLGGDSIRTIQVLNLAKERGIVFSLAQLYQHNTIRELSTVINKNTNIDNEVISAFSLVSDKDREKLPINLDDAYPLTALQSGMIFHSELDRNAYHVFDSILLRCHLNMPIFEHVIKQTIEKHPILRTSFDMGNYSQPLQLVFSLNSISTTVGFDDWSMFTEEQQYLKLKKWRDMEKTNIFDISQVPLLRFHIHKFCDNMFHFSMSSHHAILDGWSVMSLLNEIFTCYLSLINNNLKLNILKPVNAMRELVLWEKKALKTKASKHYWEIQISSADRTLLPETRNIIDNKKSNNSRGIKETRVLSLELSRGLLNTAKALKIPLRTVLLTAHLKVLSVLYGNQNVTTGLVCSVRPEIADADRSLGLFLNTLPLTVMLKVGSWHDLIIHTFEIERGLLEHRFYPFSEIKRMHGKQLFDSMFTYVNNHIAKELAKSDELQILDWDIHIEPFTALAIGFELDIVSDVISLEILGDCNNFNVSQVSRITDYYLNILSDMTDNQNYYHNRLTFLTEAERRQLLHGFNATAADYPQGKCVHELFEAQAGANPVAAALVYEGESLSYGELNRHANRLAHRLLELGIRPDERVAICVERSLEMVIGLLGILKAGGAYVPLDPGYPEERLAYMLADSAPVAVLTQSGLKARLPSLSASLDASPAPVILLDRGGEGRAAQAMGEGREAANLASLCAGYPEHNPEPAQLGLTSRHLAYVIYTSGSTGQPKGVMNQHQGVVNRLWWAQNEYRLTNGDRILQKTPFSFDVSVWEFFLPLMAGTELVIAMPQGHQDPEYLASLIARERITTIHFVPSMLHLFLEQADVQSCSASLKRVLCSGEALPYPLQMRFHSLLPTVELHNLYGPTEAAVDVTSWLCSLEHGLNIVPIGRPIANTQIYILDGHLQPVPIGVAGEIYIGGAGVARGYLGRAALTAERFVADPYGQGRLYKTGDLGRWLPDGSIEYLGRNDFQVKVRGFRIELGEVEAQLAKCAGVKEAVVVAREDVPGDKRLVAYVIAEEGREPTAADLRAQLSGVLAEYMVPGAYVTLESFPLTPNGKLDRKALPLPNISEQLEKQYVAPQTSTEKTLTEIWSQLLNIEKVGINDNFIELGGHSLTATQLITRVNMKFNIKLPLKLLFEADTIEEMSKKIDIILCVSNQKNNIAIEDDMDYEDIEL